MLSLCPCDRWRGAFSRGRACYWVPFSPDVIVCFRYSSGTVPRPQRGHRLIRTAEVPVSTTICATHDWITSWHRAPRAPPGLGGSLLCIWGLSLCLLLFCSINLAFSLSFPYLFSPLLSSSLHPNPPLPSSLDPPHVSPLTSPHISSPLSSSVKKDRKLVLWSG